MSDQDFILVDEEEKESTGADEVDKEEKKDHLAVKKEEEKETEKWSLKGTGGLEKTRFYRFCAHVKIPRYGQNRKR